MNRESAKAKNQVGKARAGKARRPAATRSVLKEHGLRYSKPREVILSYLLERDRHVSAEGLYLDLKQRGEALSLSTVYLNLSTLAEAGLVREYKTPAGQSFYDSNVTPHYHVVCNETGAVMDVPAPEIDGVPLSQYLKRYVEDMTGWQVDEPRFSLTGVSTGSKADQDVLKARQPDAAEPIKKA